MPKFLDLPLELHYMICDCLVDTNERERMFSAPLSDMSDLDKDLEEYFTLPWRKARCVREPGEYNHPSHGDGCCRVIGTTEDDDDNEHTSNVPLAEITDISEFVTGHPEPHIHRTVLGALSSLMRTCHQLLEVIQPVLYKKLDLTVFVALKPPIAADEGNIKELLGSESLSSQARSRISTLRIDHFYYGCVGIESDQIVVDLVRDLREMLPSLSRLDLCIDVGYVSEDANWEKMVQTTASAVKELVALPRHVKININGSSANGFDLLTLGESTGRKKKIIEARLDVLRSAYEDSCKEQLERQRRLKMTSDTTVDNPTLDAASTP